MGRDLNSYSTQIVEKIDKLELYPIDYKIDLSENKVTKIPLSQINNAGIAFKPIVSMIQTAITGEGGSGIYFVNTFGKKMFTSKETGNFIGGLMDVSGAVGGGQAQMTQLACDPTLLCLAAALSLIEKKLDDIHETQKDILTYLEMKELSVLQSSLETLNDIMKDYKFKHDKKDFIESKTYLIQDIKKSSLDSIRLIRLNIGQKMEKRTFIHVDNSAAQKIEEINGQMKKYQLALYLWCYSTFLEILLSKDFNEGYLNEMSRRMQKHIYEYRELYTDLYNELIEYKDNSIDSLFTKGIGKLSKAIGDTVATVPVLNKSLIDETLIDMGEKMISHQSGKVSKGFETFINTQTNMVQPFVNNIEMLRELYSVETSYYVDKEYVYLTRETVVN